ncbi:hypothetical protein EYB45_03305 [Erythrobacteraceae bacterium CFH 75059]|uniref:hypothetical protein n=1 Tax=Qipengyuania thermophila TaxID=2509361 RepID=UPI0010216674|nr:hypothetical protein [Qipengyuania thermophila]TCD06728.1 hypothetical protein EYB45_03305 [Erythrobacteraceae bacterium CFH 75059]
MEAQSRPLRSRTVHARIAAAAMVVALSGGLAACGEPIALPDAATGTAAGRTPSAEERRAAQSLSIGNQQALAAATPYDRALLCSFALEALDGQLRERGLLNDAQRQAFAQMRAEFARQLRATAGERAEADVARDRQTVAEAHPEPGDQAQIAIGCLRRFQQETA